MEYIFVHSAAAQFYLMHVAGGGSAVISCHFSLLRACSASSLGCSISFLHDVRAWLPVLPERDMERYFKNVWVLNLTFVCHPASRKHRSCARFILVDFGLASSLVWHAIKTFLRVITGGWVFNHRPEPNWTALLLISLRACGKWKR